MNQVYPKKSLGQHFLVDSNIASKIVSALKAEEDSLVVEVGPGQGALTGLLLERYSNLKAVEIDARAVEFLKAEYPGLVVINMDVLDIDWPSLCTGSKKPFYLIGNLPYNITSPILFSLFDQAENMDEAVIMIQEEVARRLVAAPRSKAYGILSVAAQLVSRPELLFTVSRNVFRPRPAVSSAVVRLDFRPGDHQFVRYEGLLKRVVRESFNQRRKKLKNSLSRLTDQLARPVPEKWAGKRAEELSPCEFVELTNYLTP